MSEARKLQNRVGFGHASESIGNEDVELGMLSSSAQSGTLRVQSNERSGKITLKAKKVKGGAHNAHKRDGGLSGFASIAFTPVQGLELENPHAAAERAAKAESGGYFSNDVGFAAFKAPLPVAKKAKTEPKTEPKAEQ